MSFGLMRRIDGWFGRPLMWALRIFTPRVKSLHGDIQLGHLPERVICTKFIGMGSVVLSLPLLKALKQSGVKIAFWSFPGHADLVKATGYVDEVWIVRPSLFHFLPSLWKTWAASRAFKADAFLDLEPTANFSALLARLSGAKIRVGFMSAKPLRESLFTHLVALTSERHMIEHHLSMGQLIGLSKNVSTALPEAPAEEMSSDVLAFRPVTGRKRIVININTSELSWHRMWPAENWVSLCTQLLKDPAVELAFTGGRGEQERVGKIVKALEMQTHPEPARVLNFAGNTSVPQLMEVLRRAQLVVSVDSGTMHLAAWMGTPLVGLFGPETPKLYGPRSPVARVIWEGIACSPCLSVAADKMTRCRDNQCMKMIGTERVLAACRTLVALSPNLTRKTSEVA